ncbi:MAG: hypothetical protein J6S40_06835 [Thermoguttaceae bacterium]|nr:hypothetical protein [Thermoguttaceae bacterium]
MVLSSLIDLAPCATLAAYLLFLICLRLRRYTTVLNGRTDRLLLALGLSGIVVFDIGPAIIPLGSLDLYGIFALILFFLLYLQVVFYLDTSLSRRIVVYNLSESDFDAVPTVPIPEWNASDEMPAAASDSTEKPFTPQTDSAAPAKRPTRLRRAGGALVFPPRGLTLSIEYAPRSRCAVLRISGRRPSAEEWKELQNEVHACFAGRPQPPMSLRALLPIAGVCFVTGILIVCLYRYL